MKLLRAEQVAEILQIPKGRIYELARRKVIPTVAVGRLVWFDEDALRVWIDRGGTPLVDDEMLSDIGFDKALPSTSPNDQPRTTRGWDA